MADFFEALRERAISKLNSWGERVAGSPGAGRNATIEALKEMMVGHPLLCEIEHGQDMITYDEPMPVTDLYWGDGAIPWTEGHIGTDGEEAAVLVVRVADGQGTEEGS